MSSSNFTTDALLEKEQHDKDSDEIDENMQTNLLMTEDSIK